MRFSFTNAPGWFTAYLVDNFLDEFDRHVKAKGIEHWHSQGRTQLLDASVEYFSQKGFRVGHYNSQLWFDIDDTPEYTLLALQYQD